MLNNFFLSTDISIGIGIFQNIHKFIINQESKRPALIHDEKLENNKYFKNCLNIYKDNFKNSLIVENDLNSEPTYKYLEKINSKINGFNPDLIIAIGGGSTMDLGKGIALLQKNKVSALSLKGFPKNVNKPLPLITVPTIFGSGSEVSFNAVFIDEDEKRKLGINTKHNFPIATIMDPKLTMSAPLGAVISSALDTLVHCVDSFGSNKKTSLSSIFSVEGFKNTFYTLLNHELEDIESRIKLAIGSVCGTVALMNSGDGPTNGFAYYFGVKDKIPHGLAGGIFLKEVMKFNYKNGFSDYANLCDNDRFVSRSQKNKQLFNEFEVLYDKLKIPKLNEYGYKKTDVVTLASNVSNALKGSFAGNPIKFDDSSAEKVMSNLIEE